LTEIVKSPGDKQKLLKFLNNIYSKNTTLNDWRNAIVIPVFWVNENHCRMDKPLHDDDDDYFNI
jgi:patatin-like phospholipase/acyl hydrolase